MAAPSTRRRLLASVSAAGILPADASAAPSPDAELLAACAQLRGLEDEWNRLYAATTDADELITPADHAWQTFSDDVWPGIALSAQRRRGDARDPADLPRRLLELRASTPEGLAAKAAAILALEDAGCWCELRDDSFDFTRSLLKDAAGALHRPMADGTEPHAA